MLASRRTAQLNTTKTVVIIDNTPVRYWIAKTAMMWLDRTVSILDIHTSVRSSTNTVLFASRPDETTVCQVQRCRGHRRRPKEARRRLLLCLTWGEGSYHWLQSCHRLWETGEPLGGRLFPSVVADLNPVVFLAKAGRSGSPFVVSVWSCQSQWYNFRIQVKKASFARMPKLIDFLSLPLLQSSCNVLHLF